MTSDRKLTRNENQTCLLQLREFLIQPYSFSGVCFICLFLNAMQGLTDDLEGFVLFVVWKWHNQMLHFKCSIAFVHKNTFPVFSSLVPGCALEGIFFFKLAVCFVECH